MPKLNSAYVIDYLKEHRGETEYCNFKTKAEFANAFTGYKKTKFINNFKKKTNQL